jgi:hypothetical protein
MIYRSNMEARSKRLWIVTLANILVACLLLLVLFSIMLAFAVLAPEVSGWPLYILVPVGLVLSVIALMFTKGIASRASRLIASVINGCILALDLVIVFGLAALFFGSTKERFLIPSGYKGDVYVVYGAADGESLNKVHREVTYRIPEDGIFRVRGPMMRDWTRTDYYYQMQTGKLESIRNFGRVRFIQPPRIWQMTRTLVCSSRAQVPSPILLGAQLNSGNSMLARKPTS